VPKHQVGNAFCDFASITVFLPAFFPNAVDLAVVAAQIKGRVDNREETNREYRDADRPHARLPPKIRRRRLKPSEAQARTIEANASPTVTEGKAGFSLRAEMIRPREQGHARGARRGAHCPAIRPEEARWDEFNPPA